MSLEKDLKISIDIKTQIQDIDVEKYKEKLLNAFKTQVNKHNHIQSDIELFKGFEEAIINNPNGEESLK